MPQQQQKYYTVWKGRTTGVFDNWPDCKAQIHGFPGTVFKSFPDHDSAVAAFDGGSDRFIGKPVLIPAKVNVRVVKPPVTAGWAKAKEQRRRSAVVEKSVCVDGAWNNNSGLIEYQGVETATGKLLFHMGPLADGTNNIAEFLAIVHALAYCEQQQLTIPVYSDSRIAIAWVQKKEAATDHTRSLENEPLFNLLDRAVQWLQHHDYPNLVLKWETKAWGENPADFGRK